jgi:hypothetical protein
MEPLADSMAVEDSENSDLRFRGFKRVTVETDNFLGRKEMRHLGNESNECVPDAELG